MLQRTGASIATCACVFVDLFTLEICLPTVEIALVCTGSGSMPLGEREARLVPVRQSLDFLRRMVFCIDHDTDHAFWTAGRR